MEVWISSFERPADEGKDVPRTFGAIWNHSWVANLEFEPVGKLERGSFNAIVRCSHVVDDDISEGEGSSLQKVSATSYKCSAELDRLGERGKSSELRASLLPGATRPGADSAARCQVERRTTLLETNRLGRGRT